MKNVRKKTQVNSNLTNQEFSIIYKNYCDNKLHISKAGLILLNDAIRNHKGEIIEPANDDSKTMETIVSLYNKKLVSIDIENDKLFVNDLGKSLL
jgi:hypothetical protein